MTRDEDLVSRADEVKKWILWSMESSPAHHWCKKDDWENRTRSLIAELISTCRDDKNGSQYKKVDSLLETIHNIAIADGICFADLKSRELRYFVENSFYPNASKSGGANFFKAVGAIGTLIAVFAFGRCSKSDPATPQLPAEPTPIEQKVEKDQPTETSSINYRADWAEKFAARANGGKHLS